MRDGAEARLAVYDALHAAGIGVQVHYIPIYRHPYYRDMLGFPQDAWPATDEYYAGALSLPIFPGAGRVGRRAGGRGAARGAAVKVERRLEESARLLERARRVIPALPQTL